MISKKGFILYLFMFFSLFILVACDQNLDNENSGKIEISVSILPQKTFVEAVTGDKAEVTVVVPPGSSPATYEPTPQEAIQLESADLYFLIGVPAETAFITPLIDTNYTKLIPLHTKVAVEYPEIMVNGVRDQHIWLSVSRVIKMIEIIRDEVILFDEENSDFYTENAASYIDELEGLKVYASEKLSNLDTNKFIVFHPAFRYLAEEFSLEMYALEEDGKEATPQRIADMIDFAKAQNIHVIFYQVEFSSTQAQSFAEEIDGETMMLAPLSPDYINNLKNMVDLLSEVLNHDET
jgi:zinc transport system substrate-binding protein